MCQLPRHANRVHGSSEASQQRSATVDDRLLRRRHGGAPEDEDILQNFALI